MPIRLIQPNQLRQRPSADLQSMAPRDSGVALLHLQRQIDYLFRQIGSPPSIDYFSVEAAEIGTLYVGNLDGAGQIEIYSGPPSYDLVGWFGTRDSGASVAVTSITGGTVVVAGLHGLRVGNIVLISGTSNLVHNDYWAVTAIIDPSTFTISATGNSTGGEMTRQFRGGWVQEFAHGGSSPEDAPVWSNYLGQTYFGGEAAIILLGPQDQEIGFFGTDYSNDTFSVVSATNATPIVVTTDQPHNLVEGDTCYIFNAGGNTAANGLFIARNLTADALELYDLSNSPVAGNGSYSGGATLIPYDSGILVQTIAIGQSFDNYKLRAFRDGSLRIKDALIELTGATSSIILDPDTGTLRVTGPTSQTEIFNGAISVYDLTDPGDVSTLTPDGLLISDAVGGVGVTAVLSSGIDTSVYKVNGTDIITSSRDITNAADITADTLILDSVLQVGGNALVLGDLTVAQDLTVTGSFDAGGADATGVPTIGGFTLTTTTLNYKDHAGLNQSMSVVTGGFATGGHLWDIDGGIISSFA